MTRKPEKAYFLAIMLVAVLLVSTTLASLSTTVSFHNSGRIDYPIISYGKTQQSELRAALIKFIFNYNHDDELICQTMASTQYTWNLTPWLGQALCLKISAV